MTRWGMKATGKCVDSVRARVGTALPARFSGVTGLLHGGRQRLRLFAAERRKGLRVQAVTLPV